MEEKDKNTFEEFRSEMVQKLNEKLYENRDKKVVLVDDATNILLQSSDPASLNLLKAAVDSQGPGKLYYVSKESEIPSFVFKPKLVFTTNFTDSNMEKLNGAISSRVIVFKRRRLDKTRRCSNSQKHIPKINGDKNGN